MPSVYTIGVSRETKERFRSLFVHSADVVLNALIDLCQRHPEECRNLIEENVKRRKKGEET